MIFWQAKMGQLHSTGTTHMCSRTKTAPLGAGFVKGENQRTKPSLKDHPKTELVSIGFHLKQFKPDYVQLLMQGTSLVSTLSARIVNYCRKKIPHP